MKKIISAVVVTAGCAFAISSGIRAYGLILIVSALIFVKGIVS